MGPGTALNSKGCAIVKYATPADAKRAIRTMTETSIRGRNIFVREDRESRDGPVSERSRFLDRDDRKSSSRRARSRSRSRSRGNCRVFVGNLPYSATWQDLKDHMRDAGDVVFCDIIKQPGTAMGSKGCGLVEFASSRDARRAIRDLTDTTL